MQGPLALHLHAIATPWPPRHACCARGGEEGGDGAVRRYSQHFGRRSKRAARRRLWHPVTYACMHVHHARRLRAVLRIKTRHVMSCSYASAVMPCACTPPWRLACSASMHACGTATVCRSILISFRRPTAFGSAFTVARCGSGPQLTADAAHACCRASGHIARTWFNL